jgi:hypothetical protein
MADTPSDSTLDKALGTPDAVLDLDNAEVEKELVENIRAMLENAPFTVINVHPRPDEPTTCQVVYSIGLGKHGFPEIIAGSRLDIEMMATLVDNVAAYWLDKGEAQIGVQTPEFFQDPEGKNLPLVIRYIDADAIAGEVAVSALKTFYGGTMPTMVQLLITAMDGKLPSDEGYDQERYFQPLLKAMETPSEKKH